MPRELVVIQVGQCGNQIGTRFWEMALREHAAHNPQGVFDDAMSSFFRNVDARFEPPQEIPLGGRVRDLRARAVVIDMEEGVVNSLLQGPLGDLFDHRSMLTDVSGAGNNWAHGYAMYGPKYHDNLVESVRAAAEHCDSLQSFLVTHSLGGGTGSGVGSYLMGVLEDEFPEVYRFNVAVFPSEDDDVITSPYNSLLSLSKLAEHSDCVFPVENQALMDICAAIDGAGPRLDARRGAALDGQVADAPGTREKPFDRMNGIAASLMLNLTSSVRFKGSLNVDVNEITMNMVPFPRLHFMTASMAPIWAPGGPRAMRQPRGLEQMFTDVLQPKSMLVRSQPKAHTTLACAMLMRGEATISDVNRCMAKVKKEMRMVPWNRDGFKIGLCSKGQVGMPQSLLCLQNNTGIQSSFRAMCDRFDKLYSRSFYLHHYTQYIEQASFDRVSGSGFALGRVVLALERCECESVDGAGPVHGDGCYMLACGVAVLLEVVLGPSLVEFHHETVVDLCDDGCSADAPHDAVPADHRPGT